MRYISKTKSNVRDIKNLIAKTEFIEETNDRSKMINREIRKKYSISDEIAILRKALHLLNINDPELEEYNNYVNECKTQVDVELERLRQELERLN